MTNLTQPSEQAEITSPISADLRRMPGLSEQDAGLLEQAASMLDGLQNDERNRGNCSTAEGAACSAHAVRRLAVQLLRAAPPAPAAVAVPDGFALVPKRLTRAMERVLLADEEGWQWEDLLAAAEAITEQEYAALAAAPAAPAAPAVDARAARDAVFEAVRNRLCELQRYSFGLDDDGVVRRAQDRTGNWIEFDDAHELFDPVAVEPAIAAQAKGGA